MNESPENPAANRLGPSINETNLVRAIELSGYPLQGLVAAKLKQTFTVSEEWGYIDRETKDHRSLDIFAYKRIRDDGAIRPSLVLLVECKRSVHPYVFFRNVVDREIPRFPRVAGVPPNSMHLQERGSNRVISTWGAAILGLMDISFVRPGPPHCSAFGQATAREKNIQMSGEDPYKSLILPLTKAIDHTASLYGSTHPNAAVLYPTMILCIAAIDAPLIVVENPAQPTPILTPWIRVPRQEARANDPWTDRVWYAVDVVHSAFLDEFLSAHLIPLSEEFASRAAIQSQVLLKGGSVQSFDNWRWDDVQPLH